MPGETARERSIEAIRRLPPDATYEDAINAIVLLARIDAGLAELDGGHGVPHDEVTRRLQL